MCNAFDLGTPAGPLEAVRGGLSHRVWRLTTDRGRFAVKEMNRDAGNAAYTENVERATAFERLAYEAGIPMPRPLAVPGSERYLTELPGVDSQPVPVRVHEWVDGWPAVTVDEPLPLATTVGATLARIHALVPLGERAGSDLLQTSSSEEWYDLAARATSARLPFANELRSLLPQIAAAEAVVHAARSLPWRVVLSHRDLDPANTLLTTDGVLYVIDWDAAGPCASWLDVAAVILDWAGVHGGEPDPAVSHTLLAAYRAAGGVPGPAIPEAFGGFLSACLDWLAFNVHRGLGERLRGPEDVPLAARVARSIIAHLPRWLLSLDRWARLLA